DTAGTREPSDLLEREGVRRTHQQVEQADLVIQVVDASLHPINLKPLPDRSSILVLNKSDLGIHPLWREFDGVRLSCKKRTGLDDSNQAIWDRVMGEKVKVADIRVAINARHQACLRKAKQLLA